jgi:hypothetical protein
MSRLDHALNPTDAAVVMSSLKFDVHWLLELSNADPLQFTNRAEELYSLMNVLQLVTSRFAHVCNDNQDGYERDLDVLREVLKS